MEAWKEELYHWGVKGMKWRKHKKSLEDLGREYEQNERRLAELADYTWDNAHTKDNWKYHRMVSETEKAFDNAYNSAKKLKKHSIKIAKKIQKDDPKRRLVNVGERHDLGKDYKGIASGSSNVFTGTDEAKAKAKKRTSRRVKRINAVNKAKSYVKNLFKKKG